MKISIQYKLFGAMLFAALAVVGYMAVVIQWSFDRGFLDYVNTEEQTEINRLAKLIEAKYAQDKSWEWAKGHPLEILKLHASTLPESRRRNKFIKLIEEEKIPEWFYKPEKSRGPRHPLQRTVLLDKKGFVIFGFKDKDDPPYLIPIMFHDIEVGRLGLFPPHKLSETHQLLFVEKQKLIILMVGIAAVFITVGISLPLAYHLTKPIRRLSLAAKKLNTGDYSTRVSVKAEDELGRLSQDFNALAQTLEENEKTRKQWVSDIAHELRTPLTSLRGEIEALQDGIRKPGKQTYSNLHHGIVRLGRLVEDLYDLAESDLGSISIIPEDLDFVELTSLEIASHQQEAEQAGLVLEFVRKPNVLLVNGDKQRLQQLIGNLLTNSLKYTHSGGKIQVFLKASQSQAILEIQDTSPGVPDESLSRLFNRLYRVDQSRNRSLGGSGLGLSICTQIINAHGGTITAQHSPLGGLSITVTLPLATIPV